MTSVVAHHPLQAVSEKLERVDLLRIPQHIAIIMDGNRRWAKQNGLSRLVGHWKGAEVMTSIVTSASHLGVKVLTVYAFSTENWKRPSEEVQDLMQLFKNYLNQQKDKMVHEGVRLGTIGDTTLLPLDVQEALARTQEATRHCDRIELVLALNYGGRDDIRRATLALLEDYKIGKILKEDLSEKLISSYLDTAPWPDPELLIRTSGERRLSNFLLWQLSYTEMYVTDTLWPDFNEAAFLDAILEYQRRERRLGQN